MRAVMFLLACIAAASATTLRFDGRRPDLDGEWNSYKQTFKKRYPTQIHETVRRIQWEKNLKYIQKHNIEADLGKHTYFLGINEYSDLSNEEFKQLLLCGKKNLTAKGGSTFLAPANTPLPKSVDWRKEGYVTGVKNQGQCGSCWAFSATGSLEGQHFKKTGTLVSLSEQQLVDCSTAYGNYGCEGGLQDNAFRYIKDNGGIDTEASYPYTATDGSCHYNASNVGANLTGYVDIQSGNEAALQEAVATVGPISVGIDASHPSFQLYSHGVYFEPYCSSGMLDHGVLVVGYGFTMFSDYWLVKNSWGTSWGMDGYIEMSRNNDNQCGIATKASYPLV